jgi:hypothetical protein
MIGSISCGGSLSQVNCVPSPNMVRLWADTALINLMPGQTLILNAKPGTDVRLESSQDFSSWSEFKSFENFSGVYVTALQTDAAPRPFSELSNCRKSEVSP